MLVIWLFHIWEGSGLNSVYFSIAATTTVTIFLPLPVPVLKVFIFHFSNGHYEYLINSLVLESEGSTPLFPKFAVDVILNQLIHLPSII
jgi:ABC-type maltose transport system permease subunit